MIVIYKHPANPEAFDEHYFGVHIPLAKKLPGLRKSGRAEVARPEDVQMFLFDDRPL